MVNNEVLLVLSCLPVCPADGCLSARNFAVARLSLQFKNMRAGLALEAVLVKIITAIYRGAGVGVIPSLFNSEARWNC